MVIKCIEKLIFIILVFICLECLLGIYGLGCLYCCIEYCLNDKVCNVIIGRCDDGCRIGYMGEKCDIGIFYYKRKIIY